MKKILAILLLLIFIISTAIGSFTWWDNQIEELEGEDFIIGRGQRLLLYNQSPATQGLLVPKGSYFSNKDGFVSEYRVDYLLTLDEGGATSDLLISVNDLLVGGLAYDSSLDIHTPLYVDLFIENESLDKQYDASVDSSFSFYRVDQILSPDSDVKISLIFSLANQDTNNYDKELLDKAYSDLKNKEIGFNLKFEIPIPN